MAKGMDKEYGGLPPRFRVYLAGFVPSSLSTSLYVAHFFNVASLGMAWQNFVSC